MAKISIKEAAVSWPIPVATFKNWEAAGTILPARRVRYGMQKRRAFSSEEIKIYKRLIEAIQEQSYRKQMDITEELKAHRREHDLPDVGR